MKPTISPRPGHVLTFRVAGVQCALAASVVREVVPLPATIIIPGQPSLLEGFLDLRGALTPIIRLGILFGAPTELRDYTPVIIVDRQQGIVGLIVEEVTDVLAVGDSELKPLKTGHAVNECAIAGFEVDGTEVVLIDADRMLLAEETRRLAEMQSKVALRLADVHVSELTS